MFCYHDDGDGPPEHNCATAYQLILAAPLNLHLLEPSAHAAPGEAASAERQAALNSALICTD